MIRIRDTRYDHPAAIGSLRRALAMWATLADSGVGAAPCGLRFTFTCRNEARADRVAHTLRRRRACAAANVVPSSRRRSELWHVQGGTLPLPQSLANLEQLSNWLRDVAASHQVALVRLTLG